MLSHYLPICPPPVHAGQQTLPILKDTASPSRSAAKISWWLYKHCAQCFHLPPASTHQLSPPCCVPRELLLVTTWMGALVCRFPVGTGRWGRGRKREQGGRGAGCLFICVSSWLTPPGLLLLSPLHSGNFSTAWSHPACSGNSPPPMPAPSLYASPACFPGTSVTGLWSGRHYGEQRGWSRAIGEGLRPHITSCHHLGEAWNVELRLE